MLDLHQPGDVARLLDLAAACDVVVENFRPGVLDRFGAGWPALSAVNPRLVMLSISGFGQDGHEAERAAYAPVIHAEAGLIGRQADISGDPPADIAFALADALAGLHGTIAILAALRLRDRTGTGQHIDVSMLDAMLATDDYTHYSIDEHRPARARQAVAARRPDPSPPTAGTCVGKATVRRSSIQRPVEASCAPGASHRVVAGLTTATHPDDGRRARLGGIRSSPDGRLASPAIGAPSVEVTDAAAVERDGLPVRRRPDHRRPFMRSLPVAAQA